jgi:hypothetical protein
MANVPAQPHLPIAAAAPYVPVAPLLEGAAQNMQQGQIGAGNIAMIDPQEIRTYHAYYLRASLGADYAALMNTFSALSPVVANVLLERVIGNTTTPQTYLQLVRTAQGLEVYCVHRPSRFVPSLDGTVSAWDNGLFAFLGEVIDSVATTVYFPSNAFELLAPVVTYDVDHGIALLQAANAPLLFEPILPGTANTSLATTRRITPVPTKYAHLFLDSRGYLVADAWKRLHAVLVQDQALEVCQPLVEWFRVALTKVHLVDVQGAAILDPQGQAIIAPANSYHHLSAPAADRDLIQHRYTFIHRDLPALGRLPTTTEGALLTMANAVMANTRDTQAALVKRNEMRRNGINCRQNAGVN